MNEDVILEVIQGIVYTVRKPDGVSIRIINKDYKSTMTIPATPGYDFRSPGDRV